MLDKAKNKGEPQPYLRNLNVRWFDFDLSDVLEMRFLPEEADRYTAVKGDVLVCEGGYPGRAAIWDQDEPIYFQKALHRVRFYEPERNKWFLYYLHFCDLEGTLSHHFNGAGIQHFTGEALARFELPCPPIPEQQRIVAILDEAFDGIATARANAERNLRNARALFESHLQAVFSQRGEGWERVALETLLKRGWIEGHLDGNHGGDYPRKEEFISEGVPYISANCLDDDRIDMSRAKYLSPYRAGMLRKGIARDRDVLFAHNATVGPVAILRTDEAKVILGTSLTYYRCNLKHILPEYLAHYMRSFCFRVQYEQVMKQSTRNQVPITKQREFFHVIPPIDVQENIVVVLDRLFEKGRELESIYQRKLAALDELKQSLLHQAFSGQL
ncbi:Type-1 restriction enzyme EcoKI specificity protein [Azoarcus sp. Aa7]|nr:Type-1 restriction enzyme EcoKI specificity protein [Azoarcus sp. Aa7]